MVNFFDQRKKVTLKWLGSCERKERQVKPDVKELKDSKNEYIKVKVTTESASIYCKYAFRLTLHKIS
jgi:hypothetical protein